MGQENVLQSSSTFSQLALIAPCVVNWVNKINFLLGLNIVRKVRQIRVLELSDVKSGSFVL